MTIFEVLVHCLQNMFHCDVLYLYIQVIGDSYKMRSEHSFVGVLSLAFYFSTVMCADSII